MLLLTMCKAFFENGDVVLQCIRKEENKIIFDYNNIKDILSICMDIQNAPIKHSDLVGLEFIKMYNAPNSKLELTLLFYCNELLLQIKNQKSPNIKLFVKIEDLPNLIHYICEKYLVYKLEGFKKEK